jgi:hypothetical protein
MEEEAEEGGNEYSESQEGIIEKRTTGGKKHLVKKGKHGTRSYFLSSDSRDRGMVWYVLEQILLPRYFLLFLSCRYFDVWIFCFSFSFADLLPSKSPLMPAMFVS